jgi:hypothetical protein
MPWSVGAPTGDLGMSLSRTGNGAAQSTPRIAYAERPTLAGDRRLFHRAARRPRVRPGVPQRCLAYPLGDGFVIAVLRGAESHWVRNVMAAGELTLRTKGRDFLVDRPEFIAPVRYS